MTTFRNFAAILLVAVSCSRENIPQEPLVHYVIEASAGAESPDVKTLVNPENDTKVLWSPQEEVGIFTGTYLASPYLFTGTNAAASASARFEGDGPAELGTYLLVYPYDAASSWAYPDVTATLPSVQVGKAGSFADGMALMAGTSSTSSVVCRHICSGIRFKVTGADILSVTLKGNNNEKIAGRFEFHFDEGVPVAASGTEDEVILTPDGGGCFTPGEWYYITCLPTVFTGGITLTAVSAKRGVGTYAINSSLTFTRAIFKNKANLDGSMSWTPVSASASNTYYGPANSFCLTPGQSVNIDVGPKFIAPGWKRSGVSIGGTSANACEILWNTGTVSASLSGSTLTVNAGGSNGTALVAIKNGNTILWSFLIWVTSSSPASTDLGGNLLFQWGRKDPLVAGYSVANQGNNGLVYSIQHPTVSISAGDNAFDWFTDTPGNSDTSLWGSSKTVWDPCPSGWKVPESGATGFTGCWSSISYLSAGIAWGVYFTNSGDTENEYRFNTVAVRCVRE